MSPDPGTPTRILMTADTVGGVWNYALELARGLGRAGTSVILATMGPPPRADQREAAARLPNVTLHTSRYRLEWMDDPWADVRAAGEWLLSLEQDCSPEVVHLNGYAHGALPWRAPTVVVGHSCVLSWWEAVKGEPAPPRWDAYRRAVADGLRAAGGVVAPSHAMLRSLQRHYGPFERAMVVPNGHDVTGPATPPAAKAPVVLGVGRWWDEAKNCALLARTASGLPWPLHLAGETTSPSGERIAPPANVERLGRCSAATLAQHYARAAVFAAPARYEPFGLAILEAAAAGCALVLGDLPSLRENWSEAAVFVPPGDEGAIRAALAALIADPPRRGELAVRARRRALHLSTARMTAGYLSAYVAARRATAFA